MSCFPTRRSLMPCIWAAALSTSALLSGCQTNLRGDNFSDDFAHWGEKQRPADTTPGQVWGFSEQAQQVERNLGVR